MNADSRKSTSDKGVDQPPDQPPDISSKRPTVSVLAATRRELEDAGRLNTPLGAISLVLADRIDHAENETGSVLASLCGVHRQIHAAALAGTAPAPDVVDELATRRTKRIRKPRHG